MVGVMISSRISCFFLVILLVLLGSIDAFVPVPKAIASIKKSQVASPSEPQLMPQTSIATSTFKVASKLDTTSAAIDTKKVFQLDPKEFDTTAWRGVVLGICVVWSTNFAVIKEIFHAVPSIDPSLYAAIRFSLAGLVMLPRMLKSVGNTELIISSMTVGLSVFFGYFGQAVGLMTTTANKSAFICSLNVVCVALLSSVIKKEFKAQTWISSFLAVLGVAVLESDGNAPPVVGDIWSLCQPVGFGLGYVALEYVVAKFPDNPGAITAYKILSIAIASIVWAISNGHTLADLQPIMESNIAVGGLLYTGAL